LLAHKGRFLVDIVTSDTTDTPTGNLDGVAFPDSISSTVALIGTDPTQSTGSVNLGGLVFEMDSVGSGPTPAVSGVLNAADSSGRLSPGVLAAVYGTNFGTGPAASVSVIVGGKAAAVQTVSPNQLGIQIPVDAAVGGTNITVKVNNATSAAFNITLDAFAPAIFSSDGSGSGIATAVTATSAKVTLKARGNPGDTLSAFATGLGPTTPATPTGSATAMSR